MKNFKKSLLTLTNVLKSSTELKNFLVQLKKNLLKNILSISNGNASETKANESFDNGGAVCKGATPSVEQPGGRGFKPRLRSLLD